VGSSRSPSTGRRSTTSPPPAELRDRLLDAMRELLQNQRFAAISVADVLRVARVSRASFYFYFPSRQALLGELVRRAVTQGHDAARPWTAQQDDRIEALRSGIASGAALWQSNAGVLRAIVESWGSDEDLRQLWLEQMGTFTDAAVAVIQADPAAVRRLANADVRAVAASLTWLGERLYYLAAAGVHPFNDQGLLVDTLLHAWTSTLYGLAPDDAQRTAIPGTM